MNAGGVTKDVLKIVRNVQFNAPWILLHIIESLRGELCLVLPLLLIEESKGCRIKKRKKPSLKRPCALCSAGLLLASFNVSTTFSMYETRVNRVLCDAVECELTCECSIRSRSFFFTVQRQHYAFGCRLESSSSSANYRFSVLNLLTLHAFPNDSSTPRISRWRSA